MIVMKFGGTSNQDAAAMSNVVRIIRERRSRRPIIVISAIAQATNDLERAGRSSAQGDAEEAIRILRALMDRHHAILGTLVKDAARKAEIADFIARALSQLEALARGVAILRELTPRAMDAFCSYGELLSSRLVAAALQEDGLPAEWFDTAGFMVTTAEHGRALPLMDIIAHRAQSTLIAALAQGRIPVTQGFIGVTTDGFRTTMGRESSDYSASIIGAAAGVEEVQIWTDVDGVLTADPRLVPGARKLTALSFEEAFEVSRFGAKVLHPHTVVPSMERGIPVHIYNSRNPRSTGTKIAGRDDAATSVVKSIAFKRDISRIRVAPRRHGRSYLLWEQVVPAIARHDLSPLLVSASDDSIVLVAERRQATEALLRELTECGECAFAHGFGLVTLVGEGIADVPDLHSRVFAALRGMQTSLVSSGSSPLSCSVLLPENAIDAAVRQLHDEFFPAGTAIPGIEGA
jgi:aspartate kinase